VLLTCAFVGIIIIIIIISRSRRRKTEEGAEEKEETSLPFPHPFNLNCCWLLTQ